MQEKQTTAIGIDIGATTTRVGVVTSDGRLLARRSAPTSRGARAADELIARLIDDVTALRPEAPDRTVSAIGLAIPGLVDPNTTTVRRTVNAAFLEGDWLVRELTARSDLPVTLQTDIAAATWAEFQALATESCSGIIANAGATAKRSAAVPPRHRTDDKEPSSDKPGSRFAHLRFGTGIGLGVIINGKPQPVEPGRTTHARVLIVDERDDAPLCPCGLRGCLELYAGGTAMVSAARSIGLDDGLPQLEQAVAAGDVFALELLDATSGVIVCAVENITRHYAPEVIVLGGGVLEHLPSLWTRIAAPVEHAIPPEAYRLTRRVAAQLGDKAGVIGAALMALRAS